ncbi:MAG: hypothetical protein DWH78_15530 [Planctomycetota bacterium]|nr:MAG: hypothetical protein DWH78_15530 [Planctomycetota bacterium]
MVEWDKTRELVIQDKLSFLLLQSIGSSSTFIHDRVCVGINFAAWQRLPFSRVTAIKAQNCRTGIWVSGIVERR